LGVLLERFEVWIMMIIASLLGAVGNILFKIGTEKFGVISPQSFLDVSFIFNYLFTPSIFTALVIFFLGRFLMGSPLSVLGVTQTFVAITVLSLIFTLILETLILKMRYDVWTYVGLAIGLISIALISRGISA
jgi:hypothetical protein